ncbi:MAG: IS66 family transposase, partial [Planctomycetota bacterium]
MGARLDLTLGPNLTAEQAERIFAQGKEAVIFALLEQAKMLRELQAGMPADLTPATPSASVPTYQKPPPKKRPKTPGKKAGQPGRRRPVPAQVDQTREHRAERCPDCGGSLNRCRETRARLVEDIPEDLRARVTRHVIHRDWCPACKKHVEPKVTDALPGAQLGNRTLALSAWLHYALGNTTAQIVSVLDHHLRMTLTAAGLLAMWHRLADVLQPWYEQIRDEALNSGVLHGDESGWRVNGKTRWLWCFCTREVTWYMIDCSRGSPALKKIFRREFVGTLVTDFWPAYNAVVCGAAQKCLGHLLRDLKHTTKYKSPGPHWPEFRKKLKRLIRDAIRLRKAHGELPEATYASRRDRLHARLDALIAADWQDRHARRLVKRLKRHRSELFTFLDQVDVPFDNNHA